MTLLPVSSTRSGQLAAALGSWYPGGTLSGSCRHPFAPHAVQISPGKNANFLCTNAAFTVGVEPLGFAVMCQLASTPSALTLPFLSVASHICTRSSSRPTLADQPLPSASG